MKSTAAGQLLGYSIQFPRALYHLLHIPIGGSVGIEVLGDVTSFFPDGTIISEEDKSSINSNPLTNRSTDLWKTFYNWINAVNNQEIDLETSIFMLYCNKQGQHGLVNDFDIVRSDNDAEIAIKKTTDELKDISDGHDIWKYYDYVVKQNKSIFKKILPRFELKIGKDAGYDEVRVGIKEKIVHEDFVEYLLEHLSGWLQIRINEKIATKETTIISYNQFHQQFLALFRKVRSQSLINWASHNPPEDETITTIINTRPNYVKQLGFISVDDDELVEAVSDFIKADINRNKWIETGVIDEDAALDFENRLKSYWKNTRSKIAITQSDLNDEAKGKLLLLDCKTRQEPINDLTPPDKTIPGSYHALSDRKEIGWHPNWEDKFNED